jgi:hypothetical protein
MLRTLCLVFGSPANDQHPIVEEWRIVRQADRRLGDTGFPRLAGDELRFAIDVFGFALFGTVPK